MKTRKQKIMETKNELGCDVGAAELLVDCTEYQLKEYRDSISTLLEKCEDISLLDLIYQLLRKCLK